MHSLLKFKFKSNLIGSQRSPDFPVSDHDHCNGCNSAGETVMSVNFQEWTFYTSIDNKSTQVYLYSLLNGKESHCY